MNRFTKHDEFASVNKRKSKINLLIIGLGIIAIVITGFFYVSRLDNTDSPSMAIVSSIDNRINL